MNNLSWELRFGQVLQTKGKETELVATSGNFGGTFFHRKQKRAAVTTICMFSCNFSDYAFATMTMLIDWHWHNMLNNISLRR